MKALGVLSRRKQKHIFRCCHKMAQVQFSLVVLQQAEAKGG